ncbi:hypothetical protein Tco_0253101 [Tanacetum coccineum]
MWSRRYGLITSHVNTLSGLRELEVKLITFVDKKIEVLQKSFEELKQARTRDKKLFVEAKEENRLQYEEILKYNEY